MVIGTIKSIYDLDLEYLKNKSIKALVCDLDQTLCSAFCLHPEDRTFKLKQELNSYGIQLIVLSNNFAKRVKPFCENLEVKYLPFSMKFMPFKVKHYLKKIGLKPSDCIFVGDQMRTDGKLCKMLKARLILTTPLDNKDNFFTRLHRKRDEKLILKLKEKNQLGDALPDKGGKYVF